jgi:hypothetical protein
LADDWTRDIGDQTNVTLDLNLPEVFPGKLVPDSSRLREAIGQEVIDIIRERTQKDERSWKGYSFRNYSDEYAESIDFKAYNKSKDEPNLTQSGDMLGLMTLLEAPDPGVIRVGWNDTLQSEKAHGHITGSVGVKRDFFGLTSSEIKKLRDKFAGDLEDATTSIESGVSSPERTQGFLEGRVSIAQRSVAQIVDLFFGEADEEA